MQAIKGRIVPSGPAQGAGTTVQGVDLKAIKQGQQKTWASGDFSVVAARIVYVAEQLVETADVQAGDRVLDVATGSGNAAIAAARRNADVVGIDYVPALLERGRIRAAAEHLQVEFVEGDAEDLRVPDGSFDVVTSVYGTMFAPDHRRAAAELMRACRASGKIALASWTPEGFLGEMFKLMAKYIPPTPGVLAPVMWGNEAYLRSILGEGVKSIASTKRVCMFKWRTAEENVAFFKTYYGPTLRAFERLSADHQRMLSGEMANLMRRFDRNRGGGAISIEGEYLESVIVKV